MINISLDLHQKLQYNSKIVKKTSYKTKIILSKTFQYK